MLHALKMIYSRLQAQVFDAEGGLPIVAVRCIRRCRLDGSSITRILKADVFPAVRFQSYIRSNVYSTRGSRPIKLPHVLLTRKCRL